jgi:F-box protein 21
MTPKPTMARPAFTDLPTELLEAIFLNLDPHSLIAVSTANKSIRQLTADASIIWRNLCKTQFKTWDARHNITAKFAGPLFDVDWRSLFITKYEIGCRVRDLLEHVLSTQHERILCINEIADYGYDAKETLLKECACPDDAEDVLARRYYANAVLERIHREVAIKVWSGLGIGDDEPLERALGAYDVFARVGLDVDIDVVTEDINDLANGLLEEHPDFRTWSPRKKAFTLASYLRDRGFNGVPDSSYRAVRNNFIGLTIRTATHHSLPLISVAIYCAVAQRFGLDARPVGFLFHVYTLVYAPPNHNLDGEYKPSSSVGLDSMYLDPFRSTTEVRLSDLKLVLRDMNVPTSQHEHFLSHTNTREMVLRTARNVMNSVMTIRQTEAGIRNGQALWATSYPDMDNAFYATIWAMLLLGPIDDNSDLERITIRRRQYLPYLLEHFQKHFPWDVILVSRYVIPMFYDEHEERGLTHEVREILELDAIHHPGNYRSKRGQHVKFKVGQLFRHKRYGYEGVVTGWDIVCSQDEAWIQNMGVDALPNGRNQAFYHVL